MPAISAACAVRSRASLSKAWPRPLREKRGQIRIKLTHCQAPCTGPSKIHPDLVAWREPHILTD